MNELSHAPVAGVSSLRPQSFVAKHLREISVATAYLVLLIVLAGLKPSTFTLQFRQTWLSAAPILVAAVGMTLVILARHIDISIGSQFSVCGIVAALLGTSGLPMVVVAAGTLLAGAAMGAVNGILVASLGLPSIVVTLATMVVLRGALMWISEGAQVRVDFQWFGASQQGGQLLIVLLAAVVFVLFAIGLKYVAAGRAVYAVGSDQEAARLAGVRPRHVVFTVFVLMGALAGLAALLNAAQFAMVYPNAGEGLELQVIAAVVVGGTAISGGRGALVGTLLGVALLATIAPVLVFLHSHWEWANSQWARAIQGMIILLAVASDGLSRKGH